MRAIGLILLILLSSYVSTSLFAQSGQVIESGDIVLDPNLDGFISATNSGFSIDGYDVDEFELKMFGIPIFGDGEALNDVQSGQPCGVVDLALDTAGYALYAGYDNNENLIFRFRLAGDKKSVQSYSILIDTDQLVGAADPNSSAINPGFEVEITLIQKFGVYIYDIDGVESCPTPIMAYDVDTHQQKATSSQESCGDSDIYIDFYVPFSDLTTLFGITPDTNVRFAGVTNISATCALDGSISDIGGVDDIAYDGCFSCAVLDLTENQCPSSVSNLCDTCGGFPLGATATPEIDLPVIVGDLNISGVAEPESDIYIALFSGIGNLLDRDTIATDIAGLWQSTDFLAPLNFGDSVVVNALLAGKCESGLTDTGLSFAIVSPNQPPQITGSNLSITYIENNPPIIIIDDAVLTDDNTTLVSAEVIISSNYEQNLDILSASPPPGITVSFSGVTGALSFTGNANLTEYESALRSVTFHNLSDAPSLEIRTVSFIVNDGTNSSQPFNKSILITEVNDPPVIVIGTNPIDTITVSTYEDVPLQICIDAEDVDLDILSISSANVVNDNGTVLIEENLCSTFTPFENYNGLEFINIIICDDGSPALCDTVVVKIDVLPVNDPPEIIFEGVPTDSLSYRIEQSTDLDFCLEVTDIENNNLIVESITLTSATSSAITWQSGVCFNYTPEAGFIGIDRAEIVICDDGSPSRCAKVYIDIEVIDSNLPPTITTTTADTLYIEVFKNNVANICLDATDPDNDPLAFGLITDLLGVGGSISLSYPCIDYLPPNNFVGRVLLDLTICDDISPPKCDGLVLSINVLPRNNPPQVVIEAIPVDTVLVTTTENTPIDVCLDVLDPDGDNVSTSSANTDTGNGSFVVDGSLCVQFSPDADSTGEVWGTITICDDGDPSECTETVIGVDVTPVNNPPSILFNGADIDTLYFETSRNAAIDFCIDAIDPEDNDLSIGSIQEIQTGGFYVPGSDNLCVGFVPLNNFVGETLHLITICDDSTPQGCDSVYVKINVANMNTPPEILYGGLSLDTVKVSTLQNIPIDVCVNTTDVDGDAIFLTELSMLAGEGGTSFVQTDSEYCITYSPELNYFGQTFIKMIVCDNAQPSSCTELIIEVEVINENTAPEIFQNGIVNDTIRFSTPGRTPISRCIDVLDKDGDNLLLEVILHTAFIGSLQTDAINLCIDYTPNTDFIGLEYFVLNICDDRVPILCASVVVEINVYSDNSAPIIKYQDQSVDLINENAVEQKMIGFAFSLEDSLGDNLSIAQSSIAKGNGIINLSLDNRTLLLDYSPAILSKGEHLIDIVVCDDGLPILCDSVTINLEVAQQKVFPYEAISPNGDGLNDYWVISGIEHFPNNVVHLFDRWNNLVYTLEGYNNLDLVWKGESNHGISKKDLDDGTYYYKLTLSPGGEIFSGMVVLKR